MTARIRSDARRNRARILTAAAEAFARSGTDLPMDELAGRAGVGIGTLYRHFPGRQALLDAVVAVEMDRVRAAAVSALAEEPTVWAALCRFVRTLTACHAGAVLAQLEPQPHEESALSAALASMVSGAQAERSMRADVGVTEVHAAVEMLVRGRSDAPKIAEIILDGLRSTPRE
ncbi:helix-turn-helix domain-containing protein [Amycolatopsis sp. NPDC024027]|uniref:TetR/AcrR family transcriptional regulator n=1 Tax=Amycolatopsis sp. NPDC024027 TaxID=3154327 RepID=UPI003403F8DB